MIICQSHIQSFTLLCSRLAFFFSLPRLKIHPFESSTHACYETLGGSIFYFVKRLRAQKKKSLAATQLANEIKNPKFLRFINEV